MDTSIKAELSKPEYRANTLANFIFREVIEDAHTKYNISQEDMRDMCKNAVNNAQFYIELVTSTGHFDTNEATQNAAIQRLVFLQGMYGMSWDKPECHEKLKAFLV